MTVLPERGYNTAMAALFHNSHDTMFVSEAELQSWYVMATRRSGVALDWEVTGNIHSLLSLADLLQ